MADSSNNYIDYFGCNRQHDPATAGTQSAECFVADDLGTLASEAAVLTADNRSG